MRKRLTALLALLILGSFACKEDPMREGMAAVLGGNPNLAKTSFEKVLKADPKNVEARRMMAEVHRLNKDYHLAEEQLQTLLEESREDQSPEAKTFRKRVDQQLTDIYSEWVDTLDPTQDPARFEEITKRGLDHNPRSNRLNTLLVEFYLERADRLVEKGDKAGAAQALEEVSKYPGLPTQRADAQQRARNLKLEVFTETVDAHIKGKEEEWASSQRWDAARKTLSQRLRAEVDRRLNPRNDEHVKTAEAALNEKLGEARVALMAELTGVDFKDVGEWQEKDLPAVEVKDISMVRGEVSATLVMRQQDAVRAAFEKTN